MKWALYSALLPHADIGNRKTLTWAPETDARAGAFRNLPRENRTGLSIRRVVHISDEFQKSVFTSGESGWHRTLTTGLWRPLVARTLRMRKRNKGQGAQVWRQL